MTICKEDCPNDVLARGWCRKHYLRWRKHGDPLVTLNRWGQDKDAETKFCKKCERELSVENFYKRGDSPGYVYKCKDCWKPPRDQVRARNLRKYGITLAQYDSMLTDQGGVCAICGTKPSDNLSLAVDHDHSCCPGKMKSCGKCIRGLLCEACNPGIGYFKDNPELLAAAIAYLQKQHLYHAAILKARSRKCQITCV